MEIQWPSFNKVREGKKINSEAKSSCEKPISSFDGAQLGRRSIFHLIKIERSPSIPNILDDEM